MLTWYYERAIPDSQRNETTMLKIEDICWFDFETRTLPGVVGTDGDLTKCGTYRYTRNAFAIVLAYAIGEGPVEVIALDKGFDGDWLYWDDPRLDPLKDHYARALRGEAVFAAWNTGFDRHVWNRCTGDYPELKIAMTIDVMAQATASNLPSDLQSASKFIGRGGKQADGKKLIPLFCSAGGAQPADKPEEWLRFKSYAAQDVDELRWVWKSTLQLPWREWQEYHVSEKINDRGMAIDVGFCRRAAAVAVVDRGRTNALIRQYTAGAIRTVNQHIALAEWVWDNIPMVDGRSILTAEEDEENEDGVVFAKISLSRTRVAKLITYLEAWQAREGELPENTANVLEVLRLREFGASAAPMKFKKMLDIHEDGIAKGSYVFGGAAQTGRWASKGIQMHNLTRSVIGKDGKLELPAIEMINELEI